MRRNTVHGVTIELDMTVININNNIVFLREMSLVISCIKTRAETVVVAGHVGRPWEADCPSCHSGFCHLLARELFLGAPP